MIRGGVRSMSTVHIMNAYDQELKFLASRIASMGGLAERMVDESVKALVHHDPALAFCSAGGKISAPGAAPLCGSEAGSSMPSTAPVSPFSGSSMRPCM